MKRIFAWIALLLYAVLFITAIVFSIIGGDYSFPVTMTCLFLIVALSIYMYVAQKVADILKSKNKAQHDKPDTDSIHTDAASSEPHQK